MVQIDFENKEVTCKVVYYGPGLSGKTTNLQIIHEKAPGDRAGELITINTETDRTLYFDFMPLDLGRVADMNVRLQLYTVPGQVYYNSTRRLVLQGVDGVVFVADSLVDKRTENIESLNNLFENMESIGVDPSDVPLVLQYNKRDLPDPAPLADLDADLNPEAKHKSVEAAAKDGVGVFQTLKAIANCVVSKLETDYAASMGGGGRRRGTIVQRRAPAAPPPPPKQEPAAPPAPPAAPPVAVPPTPAAEEEEAPVMAPPNNEPSSPQPAPQMGGATPASGIYLPQNQGQPAEVGAITGPNTQLPDALPTGLPNDAMQAVVMESLDKVVEHLTGMAEASATMYENLNGLSDEIRRLKAVLQQGQQ